MCHFLHGALLLCLLFLLLGPQVNAQIGGPRPRLLNQLFTVGKACTQLEGRPDTANVDRVRIEAYLADTEELLRVVRTKIGILSKTFKTTNKSGLTMKHIHLATGLRSFDEYSRQRGCVSPLMLVTPMDGKDSLTIPSLSVSISSRTTGGRSTYSKARRIVLALICGLGTSLWSSDMWLQSTTKGFARLLRVYLLAASRKSWTLRPRSSSVFRHLEARRLRHETLPNGSAPTTSRTSKCRRLQPILKTCDFIMRSWLTYTLPHVRAYLIDPRVKKGTTTKQACTIAYQPVVTCRADLEVQMTTTSCDHALLLALERLRLITHLGILCTAPSRASNEHESTNNPFQTQPRRPRESRSRADGSQPVMTCCLVSMRLQSATNFVLLGG